MAEVPRYVHTVRTATQNMPIADSAMLAMPPCFYGHLITGISTSKYRKNRNDG